MDFLQKQPKITHFQQGYPCGFSSKKAEKHTLSIGLPLSFFFKKSEKSHTFNRVTTIDFLRKQPKITHFQQGYPYRFSSKIPKNDTILNRVTPIDFLQKKLKITHFQQSYPYRFSSKIANNHTISIWLPLSIFFKKSQKSHIFNTVTPIDFLQKYPKITHFQQSYIYRFGSKIAKNHTLSIGLPPSIFFQKSQKSRIFNAVTPIDFLQRGNLTSTPTSTKFRGPYTEFQLFWQKNMG